MTAVKARRLSFEALEERQMLAVYTVSNLSDAVVTGAGQAPGSLRQAIFDANATPAVADVIEFESGLSGTIQLSVVGDTGVGASSFVISSSITIRGNTSGITIARSESAAEMRLFRVTAGSSLTLESVNVTGGVARGAAGATGSNGSDGRGGAVFNEGTLQIIASTLYNNRAIGGLAGAGGNGGQGHGGAVYSADGALDVRNTTLSGNQALNSSENALNSAFGGGIYGINGSLAIYNSTITENAANAGQGVYFLAVGEVANAVIHSSIIAQSDDLIFDLFASYDAGGTVNVTGANNLIHRLNDFQHISLAEFHPPASGNPLLMPLANNGGPTLTHALQTNSPAIDRGANPLELSTDQRGSTFARDVGDEVDVGALESSAAAPVLPGDYNRNELVDAADYVVWRKTVGISVPHYDGADGNGSGDIEPGDYTVWSEHFGESVPAGSSGSRFVEDSFLTSGAADDERKHSTKPVLMKHPLPADIHDKALLAVLLSWDGAARGEREPLSNPFS